MWYGGVFYDIYYIDLIQVPPPSVRLMPALPHVCFLSHFIFQALSLRCPARILNTGISIKVGIWSMIIIDCFCLALIFTMGLPWLPTTFPSCEHCASLFAWHLKGFVIPTVPCWQLSPLSWCLSLPQLVHNTISFLLVCQCILITHISFIVNTHSWCGHWCSVGLV